MAKEKFSPQDELDIQQSAYQQYIKRKKFTGSNTGKFFAVAVIVVFLALAVAVFYTNFFRQDTEPDRLIKNVAVGGISLQGLTADEAIGLLSQHAEELLPKDDIIVRILDSTLILSNEDTKAQLDLSAMATAAYLHGRDDLSDGAELLELSPYDFVKVEASEIRALLIAFVQPFNGRPVETTVTVTGDRPNLTQEPAENEPSQILTITVGTPKYLCDPETIFRTILQAHKTRQLEIIGQTWLVEPEQLSADTVFYLHCAYAKNASIDPETHIVTKSVYGYGFNIQQLQKELDLAQPGDVITVPLYRIKPSITTDELINTLS